MKIQDEYINKIMEVSNKIEGSIKRLGVILFNENMLEKEKDNLLISIENLNKEKQNLIQQISQQYGEGYIEPGTWEFHPKETENAEQEIVKEN